MKESPGPGQGSLRGRGAGQGLGWRLWVAAGGAQLGSSPRTLTAPHFPPHLPSSGTILCEGEDHHMGCVCVHAHTCAMHAGAAQAHTTTMESHASMQTHVLLHTHMHEYRCTCTQGTHVCVRAHTCRCRHKCIRTRALIHVHTHVRSHTCTHMHVHAGFPEHTALLLWGPPGPGRHPGPRTPAPGPRPSLQPRGWSACV